jgi:hypothetical protein
MERPETFVHGNANEDRKKEETEHIKKAYEKGYSSEHLSREDEEKLLEAEELKTPTDIEAVDLANTITNDLLVQYDLTPFDLKENNVHVIGEDLYKKFYRSLKNADACYQAIHQAVFIEHSKRRPAEERVGKILHETIHFKGFQSDQVFEFQNKDRKNSKDKIVHTAPFREGLKVPPNLKQMRENSVPFYVKFKGLNEAVVVELEKKLLPILISRARIIPKELYFDFSRKVEVASAENIDPSEIEFVYKEDQGRSYFGYQKQRDTLNFVVDSILQDNPSLDREKVMEKFFRAYFSGHILEIARLVENSFGKGSFRILSNMDVDHESSETVKMVLTERREDRVQPLGA